MNSLFSAEELYVTCLAMVCGLYLWWGARVLPEEQWQVLASVPERKLPNGRWRAVNYTYYGVLSANAYAAGVMLYVLLMSAGGVERSQIFAVLVCSLAVCVPASRIICIFVEGTNLGFTVGGASFVGLLVTPLVVAAVNSFSDSQVSTLYALAAVSISYALGEGLGRLACISFGCCYGKPLENCSPGIQHLFCKRHFVFHGKTKKVAYESRLEGQPVVPIQTISSAVLTSVALIAMLLLFNGYTGAAFLIAVSGSQLWRIYSETLRADYLPRKKFSPYQYMAFLSIVMAFAFRWLFGDDVPAISTSLAQGAASLWDPAVVLLLQVLWVLIFLYMGRSVVTKSEVTLYVDRPA